jgi:hypothetical protein
MAVADADPERVGAMTRHLGSSSAYLAPFGLAAGTIVLMLRGVKLLLLNWRLTLIQLLPAILVWVAMDDLGLYALHGEGFPELGWAWVAAGFTLAIAASVASFWCNPGSPTPSTPVRRASPGDSPKQLGTGRTPRWPPLRRQCATATPTARRPDGQGASPSRMIHRVGRADRNRPGGVMLRG